MQPYNSHLAHHGVKGQQWGVRRYQNEDGSYKNDAARDRHAESEATSPAQNSNRSRNIKRAVAITAGILATGAIAYGLYKTGAYKHGVDVAKKIFGSKGDQVAEKVVAVKKPPITDRAKTAAKKKIVDTLNNEAAMAGYERSINERINNYTSKRAEAAKAAKKAARQTARKSVKDIPVDVRDRGKEYAKRSGGFGTKIKDVMQRRKVRKQTKRAARAVNDFNQANADFISNLGNMGRHRR